MKALDIGVGDEIILQGATCAVMVTAILRTGAKPVFSDIDPQTFGSSASSIARCITPRTRMIVAQHSFGIPCDIEPITSLAKSAGVFLLEDCALTLGSKWAGIPVGQFGDAALFSTDHSKPLNTIIGGLVMAKDQALTFRLRQIQTEAGSLSAAKQEALWSRVLFQRKFCPPSRYGSVAIRDILGRLTAGDKESPFLLQDFSIHQSSRYSYPARMPAFLAAVGMAELGRWRETIVERKALLKALLSAAEKSPVGPHIPRIYYDPKVDIVPLRFAWFQENGNVMRERISHVIDTDWTWFMEPIVGAQTELNDYFYYPGSCPQAERIGPNMINIPCTIPSPFADDLVSHCKLSWGETLR